MNTIKLKSVLELFKVEATGFPAAQANGNNEGK